MPPSVADHPAKVKPVRVGAVGSATVPPLENTDAVTDEPPLESNVTALSSASHRAYRVMLFATPGA